MIRGDFSDFPDLVPHFVPLWDPGGFHCCDLPPVLPGAGNPRRPPFQHALGVHREEEADLGSRIRLIYCVQERRRGVPSLAG